MLDKLFCCGGGAFCFQVEMGAIGGFDVEGGHRGGWGGESPFDIVELEVAVFIRREDRNQLAK